MKPHAAIAAALLVAASVAHAGLVEIVWDTQQRYEQRLSLDPGGFLELCGHLTPGTKVRWRFEADAPTSFNVHYHEGKAVHFPAREEGSLRSAGTLDVTSDQDYCWMWTNTVLAPASVTVHLSKVE